MTRRLIGPTPSATPNPMTKPRTRNERSIGTLRADAGGSAGRLRTWKRPRTEPRAVDGRGADRRASSGQAVPRGGLLLATGRAGGGHRGHGRTVAVGRVPVNPRPNGRDRVSSRRR